MKTGLILVDIQNDYFGGGRMELVGMEAAATQANKLPTAAGRLFTFSMSPPAKKHLFFGRIQKGLKFTTVLNPNLMI
jgi:nicotinamidase-related amidase